MKNGISTASNLSIHIADRVLDQQVILIKEKHIGIQRHSDTKMQTIDLKLLTTINQIVDDLSKPSVHFLVHGEYSLDDGTNWIYGPILLKHGLVDFYEFYPSGIHCLVHVNKFESDENLLLRIPYEKIWKISRFYSLDFTDEQILYMKAPN